MERGRVEQEPLDPAEQEWIRRLTHMTLALRKDVAEEWLSGLSSAQWEVASACASEWASFPRGRRQALLATELSGSPNAPGAVRRLTEAVPPRMAVEVRRNLPKYLAGDEGQGSAKDVLPAVSRRLASRLALEVQF
jgi:hypothetical protein